MKPVRVLVVDDSSLIRTLLSEGLGADPGIEVVGAARDPYEARDLVVRLQPDVLTLDIEMPRMDGITFLRKLMRHRPLPVVMLSTLTQERAPASLEALRLGAVAVVGKPTHSVGRGLRGEMDALRATVKAAARARVRRPAPPPAVAPPVPTGAPNRELLALGASTGGTEALETVLRDLAADTPPTVIVQHMPAAFTGAFAGRLDAVSPMQVVEARHGLVLRPGLAALAPGGRQMRVIRKSGRLLVTIRNDPPVQGHAPSVDVLMHSVASTVGPKAVGAVLTGMGADGAAGLLAMRRAGARTLAQDEATSVVYGMPKAAFENGGAELVRPLHGVAQALTTLLRARKAA